MSRILRRAGRAIAMLGGLAFLWTTAADAQYTYGSTQPKRTFEITPLVGYFWSGDIVTTYGELEISDELGYGVALNYGLSREAEIELSWMYSALEAQFVEYGGYGIPGSLSDVFDLTVNYFQLGAVYLIPSRSNVKPFGLVSMGAAWYSPGSSQYQNITYEDQWEFAMGFGLGMKVYMSERIGLRFQGRFLFPLRFTSGGVYFGTGGAGFGVSSAIPVVQGDLSAGLIIRL